MAQECGSVALHESRHVFTHKTVASHMFRSSDIAVKATNLAILAARIADPMTGGYYLTVCRKWWEEEAFHPVLGLTTREMFPLAYSHCCRYLTTAVFVPVSLAVGPFESATCQTRLSHTDKGFASSVDITSISSSMLVCPRSIMKLWRDQIVFMPLSLSWSTCDAESQNKSNITTNINWSS